MYSAHVSIMFYNHSTYIFEKKLWGGGGNVSNTCVNVSAPFSREKIFAELMTQSILAWIMKYTKFTPSISTRFLANYSKISNILTFRLSNTRQYFAGDEKIGKYSISCTEHKVEKRFESHTLEFLPSVQRAFKG